jgi:hypothetical protein
MAARTPGIRAAAEPSYPTPYSLFNILSDLRDFLFAGVRAFPTAFAATALFLGLFTANYAMLFFLLGLLIITPLSNAAFNGLFGLVLPESLKGSGKAICNLTLPEGTAAGNYMQEQPGQFISNWMALTVFIVGYLMTNAIAIYRFPVQYPANASNDTKKQTDEKVMLRRSKALTAMLILAAVGIALLVLRWMTSCDGLFSIGMAALIHGGTSIGWFHLLSTTGQNRLSDLFGIANRLLSPFALVNEPIACLPDASAPSN